MIGGCSCAIHGWGRVPSPSCPIHNRRHRGARPALRLVREPGSAEHGKGLSSEIEAHEELLLAMLKEHRASCQLCHDRDDLWVTCALGEVLRGAWFNAFLLLIQPSRWSTVETVRPFQMGGLS